MALAAWHITWVLTVKAEMADAHLGDHEASSSASNPPTWRYGFIAYRNLSAGTFLIDDGWGECFTFHNTAILNRGRCLQLSTVRFEASCQEATFRGHNYFTAIKVTEVTNSLPFRDAPPIRGRIRDFDGKVGVLSFEDYDPNLTLRFFSRNLIDRTRPPVGSYVFINTFVFYKDGRPLTQTYRLRVDMDKLDESRAFVCPTHVTKCLSELAETEKQFIIYVGDFDRAFVEQSSSPVFSTADLLDCLPEGTYFSDFPFCDLVTALRAKYTALLQNRLEFVAGGCDDEETNRAEVESDDEHTRLSAIARGLRHLGHSAKPNFKATVIINPLPYINDVLGTSSRFSWASFASWAANTCSNGPLALFLSQVLLIRPLNIWVNQTNFLNYHSHAEFETDQSPLCGVLLAPTPVNFGFACSLAGDTSINYKHAEGLFKVAIYIFKSASLPTLESWPKTQTVGGLRLGAIDLYNAMDEADESSSAHEVREGPPFRDVKNSFVLSFTKNGTSQSFGVAAQNVVKLIAGWSSPWEVRPMHHDTFTVTPRNAEHGAQLMQGLMASSNKGLFMCMPLDIYTDTTLLEDKEGVQQFAAYTIVTFFAWEAKPGILVEILGNDLHLLAIDKRTLLVHHHRGTEYVISRITAANLACTSQKMQPLFHSLQTGPADFRPLLPKKRGATPSTGPSAWVQRSNTSRLCGVVLTGLNYTTHEDIVQKALNHFIDGSADLDKCFVQERCGRIALLVSGQEEYEEVFSQALHSPYFSLDNNSLYVTPVAYDPKRFIKLQHVPVFLKGAADSSPLPYQSIGEILLGEKDEQQVVLLREALKITDFFARLPQVSREATSGDPVPPIDYEVRVPPPSSSSSSSSSSPAPPAGAHASASATSSNSVPRKVRASPANPPPLRHGSLVPPPPLC